MHQVAICRRARPQKPIPIFTQRYGWNAATSFFDYSTIASVGYKGTTLTRYDANGAGMLNPQTQYCTFNTTKVMTLATAVRADGKTFPWAVRSANLPYIVPEARIAAISDRNSSPPRTKKLEGASACPTTRRSYQGFVDKPDHFV